jgi:hypothetical protein
MLTLLFTPGYVWTVGEVVTEDKLNLAANPTISIVGSLGSTTIGDGAVTTPKLATGVLSADADGRSKMADTYLTAAKLGPDVAGDGLTGGNGSPLAFNPDGITITTIGGKAVVKSSGAGIVGTSRNLLGQNNAGAPNNKADYTADEMLVKDASGNPQLLLSFSVTIDLTASGANGLDTGSEASNTWYYAYAIAKADGTKAGLFSTSATAPTLPSGYTYKALIGVVRNDNSSNFYTFYQQDRRVWLNDTMLFTGRAAGGSNTFESYSTPGVVDANNLDLKTIVPPNARRMRGTIGTSNNTSLAMEIAADANGLAGVTSANAAANSPLNGFGSGVPYEIPLKTAQTFYWKADSTGARARVSVNSFEI